MENLIHARGTKEIRYYVKNNYGAEVIYLSDPGVAALVTDLTGKKTVSAQDLAVLEILTGKEAVRTFYPMRTSTTGLPSSSDGLHLSERQTILARAEALETR